MLGAGGSAHRRAVQRDAGERLTRGDQPELEWTRDVASRFSRSEAARRDAPAKPMPVATLLPPTNPAGSQRALASGLHQPRRHRSRRAKRHRLAVTSVGVAALVIVGSLIMMLLSQPSASPASACGGTNDCRHGHARAFGGAPRPVRAPALTHKGKAKPSHAPFRHHLKTKLLRSSPRPDPKPTSPRPTAKPTSPGPTPASPTTSPTASPTRRATIQVSYSLVSQQSDSFRGQFTIVNNGSTAVNGWELIVVLPHDNVAAVWDATFHTNGNTLYIDPTFLQQTIAPGSSLTENFIASGSTTTPASCKFNGSAC